MGPTACTPSKSGLSGDGAPGTDQSNGTLAVRRTPAEGLSRTDSSTGEDGGGQGIAGAQTIDRKLNSRRKSPALTDSKYSDVGQTKLYRGSEPVDGDDQRARPAAETGSVAESLSRLADLAGVLERGSTDVEIGELNGVAERMYRWSLEMARDLGRPARSEELLRRQQALKDWKDLKERIRRRSRLRNNWCGCGEVRSSGPVRGHF
jgi:hypothetical protein